MKFSVTPIKPHIGAVVELDRSALLDDAVITQLRDLLELRGVLVFPLLDLSSAEQLALTERWGKRSDFASEEGTVADGMYRVSLDPRQNSRTEYVQATFFWHMDGLTAGVVPPKATLLSARAIAPKGGQTEFANTYAAYESLSDSEKIDIDNLQVFHSLLWSMHFVDDSPPAEMYARWQTAIAQSFPLVWKHRSGRKSLVIGSTADHVVNMPKPNGRALLSRLLEWTVQPDFHYRHTWQVGDLVIWDNCGTLHRVIPYDEDSGRLMHRTSIEGVEPLK
jgi:alpha-ketoglutarate-dependent taurine dioxygenase